MTEHVSAVAPDRGAELDASIILPVDNEVEHLEQEVERVRAAMNASDNGCEIIIVDEESTRSARRATGSLRRLTTL